MSNPNKGNPKNKPNSENKNQNSRGSRSMSDLSGKQNSRSQNFSPRGRGRGRGGRGNHQNDQGVQRTNPPSYEESMNYNAQGLPSNCASGNVFPNQTGNFFPNQTGNYFPNQIGNYFPNQTGNVFPNQTGNVFPNQAFGSKPNYNPLLHNPPYFGNAQNFQMQGRPMQPLAPLMENSYMHQQTPQNRPMFNNRPMQPNSCRPTFNKPKNAQPPKMKGQPVQNSKKQTSALESKDLIQELISFKGFWADIDTLSKKVHKDTKDVINVVDKYKGIFSTTNDKSSNKLLVELDPKIKFCSQYMDPTGCHKERCFRIHTCQYNLFGSCTDKICSFGHILNSNHNNHIFKSFDLDDIATSSLKDLLKKMIQGTVYPKICLLYQSGSCNAGKGCKDLHICYQLVMSPVNCPNSDNCSLNHNIHDQCCVAIFNRFNISTNESPRDLLKLLANNVKQTEDDLAKLESRCSKKQGKIKNSTGKEPKNIDWTDSESDSSRSQSSSEASCANSTASRKKKNRKASKPKENKLDRPTCDDSVARNLHDRGNKSDQPSVDASVRRKNVGKKNNLIKNENEILAVQAHTSCAWEINGNVESPYICIPYLYGKCEDLKTGCKYLHSKRTFQWQFGGKNWFNFHVFHCNIIERHFRDFSCDEVSLPVLNRGKLDRSAMKDMPCMLGNLPLKVDFTNMTLSGGKLKDPHQIRHLTTPSAALSDDKYSTVFKWFFKNDKDKWQLYEENDKCDSSSSKIEKAYLDNPLMPLFIKAHSYIYELNFGEMSQKNMSTSKIRPIRRRPQAFPSNESSMVEIIELPSHWDKADTSNNYNLIKLDEFCTEYAEVREIVNLTLFCKIEGISRIQNGHLWRQFGNKKNELKAKYQLSFLNVQKLFHCVDDEHFQDICKENLDFRIHNDNIPKQFGQGAYFFNSAATASKFCKPDLMGTKKLMVFTVIIGNIVQGDPLMTRPPENFSSNTLYDTTVDDGTGPTTFVKYNKQEYYPSYVVMFK